MIYDMSNVNMGPNIAYKYVKESLVGFENTGEDLIEFIGERDANFLINKLIKRKDYLQDLLFDFSKQNKTILPLEMLLLLMQLIEQTSN
uniref:Uncharacterized protein n=1 Tax=Lactuca sativa TaxID=4236 RepID=A0A9R1V6W0_LACSA|nr:hypothetical protein LSAT_V11C600319850 [Lactuca sativa]